MSEQIRIIAESTLKKTRRRIINGVRIQEFDYTGLQEGTVIMVRGGYSYKVQQDHETTVFCKYYSRVDRVNGSVDATIIEGLETARIEVKRLREVANLGMTLMNDVLQLNDSE